MNNLDESRIEELTYEILLCIKANYVAGPISHDRALEALNALAVATANVLDGCDGRNGKARQFFNQALEQQPASTE